MKKINVIMMGFIGIMFVFTFFIARHVNAVSIIDSGTSEPANPVTGQEFYRTDLHAHEIYDGQWIQQDVEARNVKEYGAKGDGVTDDATAIQAAINSFPTGGSPCGILYFPPGVYPIGTALTINDRLGLTIAGSGMGTTYIRWIGANTQTMLTVDGSQFLTLKDFTMQGNKSAGKTGITGIYIKKTVGGPGQSIQGRVERVQVNGTTAIGIRIGDSTNGQVSEWDFEQVYIDDSDIGVQIEGIVTASIRFRDGGIIVATGKGFNLITGGDVWLFGMTMGGSMGTAAIFKGKGAGPLRISNVLWEAQGTFYAAEDDTTSANTSPTTMEAVDINGTTGAATKIIDHLQNGPVSMIGCRFGNDTAGSTLKFVSPATGGGLVHSVGTVFLNSNVAFDIGPNSRLINFNRNGDLELNKDTKLKIGANGQIWSPNNLDLDFKLLGAGRQYDFYDSDGTILAQLSGSATGNRFRLTSPVVLETIAIGVPGTGSGGKNLRGQETLNAGTGSKVVTFPTAEPDASYYIQLTGNGNDVLWVTNKTATGFTINRSSTTGTRIVDWLLIR